MAKSKREPNPLERVLKLFADVKPGEGVGIVLMFTTIFLILNAYYILKTVREGLLIGGGGMLGLEGDELKIYASAAMAFLLLGIVPAYGRLASRVNRIKLLNICVGAVMICLAIFYALGKANVPLGLAFYLWLGIVNVFLIAQFWSFAADIYSEDQGKRVFAVVALGGSLGAILGPKIADIGKDYTYTLMAISAGLLGVVLVLYNVLNRRPQAATDDDEAPKSEVPLSKEGGFALIFRKRYLLLIALMLLVSNLVNTTGEYILANAAKEYAAEQVPQDEVTDVAQPEQRKQKLDDLRTAAVTGFYGSFFFWVNLVSFLIQAFLVSRIFKYLGVRVALFFLPVIALGGYATIGLIGGMGLLRIAKTAENATDYSLQNTVRQALFLPTSREAKYKAKAAIDTFFVRVGDTLAAAVVAAGIHVLAFSRQQFAFTNVALIVVWLALVVGITREHRRLSTEE